MYTPTNLNKYTAVCRNCNRFRSWKAISILHHYRFAQCEQFSNMNKLTLLSRSAIKIPNLYLIRNLAHKKIPSSSSSNSSSDSDTETKRGRANNDAAKKLNLLLQDMLNDKVINQKSVEIARPRRQKDLKAQQSAKVDVQQVEKKLVESVKDVAKSLGGDIKQTESELLTKLLSTSNKAGDQQSVMPSLSEIVKGMKIDRDKKVIPEMSRANQVRSILQQTARSNIPRQKEFRKATLKTPTDKVEKIDKIDLFGGKQLGYFKSDECYDEGPQLKTWDHLNERELRLAVTHPPTNYFQQMILWTEQGRIWKFPIDNEQGMDEEHNIYFTEHIFLEKYLEPWCPTKGPIRQYMELVCVGLSKNPYMSVEDKRNHIAWYKDYFTDKQKLLKEIGAVPQDFEMSTTPKISNT